MTTVQKDQNTAMFPPAGMWLLVLLRVAIGWHFLYEGIAKIFTPGWSAAGYLEMSRWIFAPVFQWMAATPAVLSVVNFLNIAGLIVIGAALMLGAFTRLSSICGVLLLALYYLANPPFVGLDFGVPAEGSYLVVNKNLVELFALLVLAVIPTGRFAGLDRLLIRKRSSSAVQAKSSPKETVKESAKTPEEAENVGRRNILRGLATVPFLGAFAIATARKTKWESFEEQNLADAMTSATIRSFNFSSLGDLKGQIPKTKIGDTAFSRLILGGNLIGGWAHARDLIYASKLVKAYHHRDKIFETLLLAEKCGVNTLLTNPVLCKVIQDYWRRGIGKIQFISDCGGETILEGVKKSIDNGAAACYVHGGMADAMASEGNFEMIGKAVDLIRQNGLPAGIGGHYLSTIQGCVDYGLKPDFWMKTFHHDHYWSAQSKTENDNIFCRDPKGTTDLMKTLDQPWIAFKTLAAGAIPPEEAFRFALENGADFLCVGMYDFQIVDDVNLVLGLLNEKIQRERRWLV